jgi:hypothetical protein
MTPDPDQPTVLASVPSDVEAAVIVTLLAANGIEAIVTGEHTAAFRAEAPGLVQVVVRGKDLPVARRVLESSAERTAIDWSQVDVGDEEGT